MAVKSALTVSIGTMEMVWLTESGGLHPVVEGLLDVASYEETDQQGQTISVDAAYVDRHLGELVKDEDLSRYIL